MFVSTYIRFKYENILPLLEIIMYESRYYGA